MFEFGFLQWRLRAIQPRRELFAHAIKLGWVGPLEGIDRLLLVPDDEDRTRMLCVMRAFTRREFLRQALDDLPLLGAGILRLVDQNVIDAPIQTIQNPSGHGWIIQQITGP